MMILRTIVAICFVLVSGQLTHAQKNTRANRFGEAAVDVYGPDWIQYHNCVGDRQLPGNADFMAARGNQGLRGLCREAA
jgi:hypothetical protein